MKKFKKYFSFLVAIVLLVSSCNVNRDNNPKPEPIPKSMSEELCKAARGHWNDCSSPCIGTDAEYCIEVCVAQCECSGIAGFGCPEGYKCRLAGKYPDEMGACIPE